MTLVPIRDSHKQVLYVFAQVQDITAQRTAEDELHRSEEKFRLLIDAVEEYAIFMLDPAGMVMSWNAGARRIKGYEESTIVGRHFRVFYPVDEQLHRASRTQPRSGPAPRVVRRGGLAGAAGRQPVLGGRRDHRRARRQGPTRRFREDHPRPVRATTACGGPARRHGRAGAPPRRHGPRAPQPHGSHRRQRPRPSRCRRAT